MAVPAEEGPQTLALEFKDFRTFLNAFSANVSQDGMFLEAAEPQPPGSEIDFEFALEGGDPLLRGRGEVVWVTGDDGSEAAGMGVRFVELDPGSARLVERIEEIRTKSGREIFDIERRTPPAPQSAGGDPNTDLLRAELESLKEEQVQERARLVADLDTVRLERDRLAERLRALEASDVTDERDGLQSELEAVRAELQSVRGETAKLEQRVEEQDADLARFAEQGKYAMIERDRLETAKKKLGEELEAVRAEVERLEAESRESLESAAQLERANGQLADLREQLAQANKRAERVEEEAHLTETELRSDLEELAASRTDLHADLERGQSELDDVRRQFEEAAGKNLELEHEASSATAQLAEARTRLETLESEHLAAAAEMEELRTRHDEMESELTTQRKRARRAQKVAERVRAEHAKLQEDLAEAQATLEESRAGTAPIETAEDEAPATLEATPDGDALENPPQLDDPNGSAGEAAAESGPPTTGESLSEEATFADDDEDPESAEPAIESTADDTEADEPLDPWAEQISRKAKGPGLWASIANKLRGEAEGEAADPAIEGTDDVAEEAAPTPDGLPREPAAEEDEAAVG